MSATVLRAADRLGVDGGGGPAPYLLVISANVAVRSGVEFTKLSPNKAYWLTVDVKGPAGMTVWLVGYRRRRAPSSGRT